MLIPWILNRVDGTTQILLTIAPKNVLVSDFFSIIFIFVFFINIFFHQVCVNKKPCFSVIKLFLCKQCNRNIGVMLIHWYNNKSSELPTSLSIYRMLIFLFHLFGKPLLNATLFTQRTEVFSIFFEYYWFWWTELKTSFDKYLPLSWSTVSVHVSMLIVTDSLNELFTNRWATESKNTR